MRPLKLEYPSGDPGNTFKHTALTMDYELMVNLENLDMRFNFQLHYLDKSPYVHGCSVATTVALTCHVGPDLLKSAQGS